MQEKRKINIQGSIRRYCERCNDLDNCTCFETEGKSHIMCNDCLFEEYGISKSKNTISMKNCFLCTKCGVKTMKRNNEKTVVTDTHIIQHFECLKCGKIEEKKIKKWKR